MWEPADRSVCASVFGVGGWGEVVGGEERAYVCIVCAYASLSLSHLFSLSLTLSLPLALSLSHPLSLSCQQGPLQMTNKKKNTGTE